MKWWNEIPMSESTREKLLATKVAGARTALASILSKVPTISYNQAMGGVESGSNGQ